MLKYEQQALHRFDVVVAVSERDKEKFESDYDHESAVVIPTGVDLDFFRFSPPERFQDVVFCGSMDWLANQDAIGYFLEEVWPLIIREAPDLRMTVIGRSPPSGLIERAKAKGFDWTFTGFVEDVRDYMSGAMANVIPIRVGGGTRLKVYEAMAAGTPVVSTTIGVEGLPVRDAQNYLKADTPQDFADKVLKLSRNHTHAREIARNARAFVEENFFYQVAAEAFGKACELAIDKHRARTLP